ncbi:hypothetical protein BDY21DRAFT_111035 [Lineolata rhizophorae]|uniref:DUF1682 domain protein n=1 Tax=Lineolata rhizophorae TaxID=578093 RepID=A0A6A6NRX9_9PEZI|nr:hypothetical protein BDY21DRAFT_111035 [Lineolata rhizophorae]
MAGIVQGLFGGGSTASPAPSAGDADFADFAGAPDPSPASVSPASAASPFDAPPGDPTGAAAGPAVPYTKWYRVWERTKPSDFYQEMFVMPFILMLALVHVWGARKNRRKAREWMAAHGPVLEAEFARVGYGGDRKMPSAESVEGAGLLQASDDPALDIPVELLKEKGPNEFTTYATGRQNVAFVDVKLTLAKRYNPFMRYMEAAMGFIFESLPVVVERMEATAYAFDGREAKLVPTPPGSEDAAERRKGLPSSALDGFVWAVVHKDLMKQLRDDRYDLSLTSTKDHPKLPAWASVMTEGGEITDAMLTPELISAIESAGEALEAYIISDQPLDKPQKLDDLIPRKRISLSLKLPSSPSDYAATLPLFRHLLRAADHLVGAGRFRPEALRRARATREDEARKIRRAGEDERAEERKLKADRDKKERRDAALKNMGADEQRKYLEKEREKEMRKSQKRKTVKG